MNQFLRRTKRYLTLPEMLTFWLFLPLGLALLILNATSDMQVYIAFANVILMAFILAIIFLTNLRLARSNLEIKIERNELKSIIDNLYDGVIAYDTDFKILVFNKAAEIIFEVGADSMVGTNFSLDTTSELKSTLLAQTMFPSLAPAAVRKSTPSDPIQIIDLTYENPFIVLRVTTIRIIDAAGNLLGFLKIITDRTREAEIIRSKTEFVSVAAHQLRTPLSAIKWTFETLSAEKNLSTEGKQFIINATIASENVLKIVNDLLDISRIEEGRFGYTFEDVDFLPFLEKMLRDAVTFALKYGISIYFDPPKESEKLKLKIDSNKLNMAFNNIIDNAIKYNTEHGNVIVKVFKASDPRYIEITIEDTGMGIPNEAKANVFKKFFRAENAVKAEANGSGLGLYIAKNIIEHHGGKIWLESEIHHGTTFHVTLPIDTSLVRTKETMLFDEL